MVENATLTNNLARITLTLLHPTQGTPIQSWTFNDKPSIRIGRAPDNDLAIQSPVVSRYHAILQQVEGRWELSSLGTNGTYVDNKQITKVTIEEGAMVRLAISGPLLQCNVNHYPANPMESTNVEPPLASPELNIDVQKKANQVEEIVSSEYFQNLQAHAQQLRSKHRIPE